MMLRDAVNQYVAWRKAHGTKFAAGASTLQRFLKTIEAEIACDAVTSAQVSAFLAGNGRLTRYRADKYWVLCGFYRYAVSRGYATSSPLPDNEPKPPPSLPPYIYSHDELRRLLGGTSVCSRRAFKLDAHTLRALLLLLYGAGLRRGEAFRLTLADVNLSAAVLTVRETKFYKSRLVPTGPQLTDELKAYATLRADRPLPSGMQSSFLAYLDGTPLASSTVLQAFARLLQVAGISRNDSTRKSPCLHSFRHTFAVHRLTAWYREGADVQRLLPMLSTYLGHKDPSGTQVYLTMTPELLQQASSRLERYVRGEKNG